MPDKKSQCDKFVLGIQVSNPNAVETTSACLTVDGLGIIVKTVAPDKFVHEQHLGISEQISIAIGKEEQVGTNFISSLTVAHNNAVAKFEDAYGETDLAMKETLYILPPETCRTNEYFNGGMSSFFI